MKTVDLMITAVFGAFWLIFGLNGFFHFFSVPTPSGAGAEFMNALEKTGYVMPWVYATQIIAGLMMLGRHFIPLALLLLGPVVANILLYDIFLNRGGLVIGAVIALLYGFLLFRNRQSFFIFLKP